MRHLHMPDYTVILIFFLIIFGIAGNRLWWNLSIGAMLTVFFFAFLWRKADIITDVEFRGAGRPVCRQTGEKIFCLY